MKMFRAWVLGLVCAIACVQASAEEDKTGVLREALKARSVVTFTYKGQARTVEPHALGKANDDKPALLAWQTAGGSNTEPPPGWRVFIVAEITDLKATERNFEKPRDDYRAKARGLKTVEAEVAKPEAAPAAPAATK
jgi:predicted DNA-binding transcriptional regulator YafY